MKRETILVPVLLTIVIMLCACAGPIPGSAPAAEDGGQHVSADTEEIPEGEVEVMGYDFSEFSNVSITGIRLSSLTKEEAAVLYTQARYCQAMTDADIDTMWELVSEDMIYTHMSGMQQTREEYFADVANGSLDYHTIGISNPAVSVDGDKAQITYTAVLNANAYGARGTFRMKGTHHYEKKDGAWIEVNG